MSYNKVQIIGSLGSDPDYKQTANATFVTLRIATNEGTKDRPHTEWHSAIAFNRGNFALADIIAKYARKGDKIFIEGSLRTTSYDKDGQKHYNTQIYVNAVEFLTRREASQPMKVQVQDAAEDDDYPTDDPF